MPDNNDWTKRWPTAAEVVEFRAAIDQTVALHGDRLVEIANELSEVMNIYAVNHVETMAVVMWMLDSIRSSWPKGMTAYIVALKQGLPVYLENTKIVATPEPVPPPAADDRPLAKVLRLVPREKGTVH